MITAPDLLQVPGWLEAELAARHLSLSSSRDRLLIQMARGGKRLRDVERAEDAANTAEHLAGR